MVRMFYTDPLVAEEIKYSISLSGRCGLGVYFDPEDYNLISRYKWSASPSGKKVYACTNIKDKSGKSRKVYMHRLIVKPKSGEQIDHINGDSLDNRRCNLRLCNNNQNQHNRGKNDGTQYKGVRKSNSGYRMTISKTFKTAEEAALSYNKLAKQLFGEFAYQNEVSDE